MAKQQEKLSFVKLLDELFVLKGKAETQRFSTTQIKSLRFIKKDNRGNVTYVDNFKLHLVKNGEEVVIIMLPE